MCGRNLQAASLLSNLFWWLDVADKKYPERQGWIYKTAEQLETEAGLTRRGYEKARRSLLDLGVIRYKRADVHGKMFWSINREKLFELIYKVRGETPPEFESEYHTDTDGFFLNKWIPLDLWNAFIKMRYQKTGRPVAGRSKMALFNQLKALHEKKTNLRYVMEKAIAGGWGGFYLPEKDRRPNPQRQNPDAEAERIRKELKEAEEERKRQAKPPPDKPDKGSSLEKMQQAREKLGIKK